MFSIPGVSAVAGAVSTLWQGVATALGYNMVPEEDEGMRAGLIVHAHTPGGVSAAGTGYEAIAPAPSSPAAGAPLQVTPPPAVTTHAHLPEAGSEWAAQGRAHGRDPAPSPDRMPAVVRTPSYLQVVGRQRSLAQRSYIHFMAAPGEHLNARRVVLEMCLQFGMPRAYIETILGSEELADRIINFDVEPGVSFRHDITAMLENAAAACHAPTASTSLAVVASASGSARAATIVPPTIPEDAELGMTEAKADARGGALLGVAKPSKAVSAPAMQPIITAGPRTACCSRALNGVATVWDRASGVIALLYGVLFGLMAFAIAGASSNPVVTAFIDIGLGILALFSILANHLQADDAVVNLWPTAFKKIAPYFGKKASPVVQNVGTALTLSAFIYLCALPTGAVIYATLFSGLSNLARASAAFAIIALLIKILATYEQTIRAPFAAITMITTTDALDRRRALLGNQMLSTARRNWIDASPGIALAVTGAYAYLIWPKVGIAIAASPFRALYPEGEKMDMALQVSGIVGISWVVFKLIMVGILDLAVNETSGRYGTSIAASALACGAGVATGLATGLSSFMSTEQIVSLIVNGGYAAVANLPFFFKATDASRLIELREWQRILDKVIPLCNGKVQEKLMRVEKYVHAEIDYIFKRGCKGAVSNLAEKYVDPFYRIRYGTKVLQEKRAERTATALRKIIADEREVALVERAPRAAAGSDSSGSSPDLPGAAGVGGIGFAPATATVVAAVVRGGGGAADNNSVAAVYGDDKEYRV